MNDMRGNMHFTKHEYRKVDRNLTNVSMEIAEEIFLASKTSMKIVENVCLVQKVFCTSKMEQTDSVLHMFD